MFWLGLALGFVLCGAFVVGVVIGEIASEADQFSTPGTPPARNRVELVDRMPQVRDLRPSVDRR